MPWRSGWRRAPSNCGNTVDKLLREIIERERAETSLQKSEARFAAFMRNLPGSAIMRDRAGRFLFANEAWELELGRRPGESLGKTVDELWPPEIAEKLKALDRQVLVENRPLQAMVELPVTRRKCAPTCRTAFPSAPGRGKWR